MPDPIRNSVSSAPNAAAAPKRPSLRTARPATERTADAKLKAVCDDMEAIFIHHMLSEMRKTVAKSGLIDGGRSEEVYTSLMDAELAKEMARSGGLGLSPILQEQLNGPGAPLRSNARKR
jgi:flagellar protein FlgJ